MDLLDALDRTFKHAHSVIAGVRADQHGDPTPCTEWTVRDLMTHMIGVVAGIGAAASAAGAPPAGPPPEFELAEDPAAQFEAAAAATLEAWRTPGVLESTVNAGAGPLPGQVYAGINLLDTATHAWDLAVATGQDRTLPDDVAVAALEASRQMITDPVRSGRFGPEVAIAAGATPTEQLVAYLGRTP